MASDAPCMVVHLSTGEAVAVPRATVARCAALTHLPGNSVTLPPDAPVSACTLHLLLDLDALAMADAAEAHNAALGAVWSGGAEAAAAAASNARGAAAGRVAAAVQERLLLLDGWRTDELAALLVAADYLGATSLFGLLIDAVLAATEDMDSAALRAALHLPDDLLAPADVAAVHAALEELEPFPTELRDRWAASGAQPRAGGGMAALPDQVLCKLLGALRNHARFLAAGLTCSSWAAAAAEEARLSFEGARVNCGFLADVFAALPPGDATSAPACVLRHCRVLNSTHHGRDDDGERDRDGGPLSVDDVTLLLRGALALIAAGSLLSCEQLSFLALTPLALRCATKAGVHAEAVNTLAAEALIASTNSAARADAAMQAESAGGDAVAVLRACVAVCAKHAAACAQAQLLLDAVANGAHSHSVWHAPLSAASEAAVRAAAAAAMAGNEELATRALAVLDSALDPVAWLGASHVQLPSEPLPLLFTARSQERGRVLGTPCVMSLPSAALAKLSPLLHRAAALHCVMPAIAAPLSLRLPFDATDASLLAKIAAWCEYHAPGGPADSAREAEVKAWDSAFVQVDQGTLFEIILVANQLGIKELLDLTCLTVSNMIRGERAYGSSARRVAVVCGLQLTRARALPQAKRPRKSGASSTSRTTSRRKRRRKSAAKISGRLNECRRGKEKEKDNSSSSAA